MDVGPLVIPHAQTAKANVRSTTHRRQSTPVRGATHGEPRHDSPRPQSAPRCRRENPAYRQYSLTANQADLGVVTFQRITRKYPEVDRRGVLADLADWSGEPGKWFAAARNDGHLDLALKFAEMGRTEPRTLSRASRDFFNSEPLFAFRVGRLAVERILAGDGYEITALDLLRRV